MKKCIVVTGAAGFIGSGVVKFLNDQGLENLVLVDELDHPLKVRNLQNKKYQFFLKISQLHQWLVGRASEIEAIIHLGACSNTLETNQEYLLENNTEYTKRLAIYALTHQIRFIYASSAATYGDGTKGFNDDHSQLEDLAPLNLYGSSKHNFDLWAKKEGVLDRIVGLKYFNVFGPNEAHKKEMASLVYKMAQIVQQKGVVKLFRSTDQKNYKDGEQCRDFIYVKDAVRMTCGFLNSKHSGIYNIGMGQPTTWNRLAQAIFKAYDLKATIEYIEMPEQLKKQYQNYTCANMQKMIQNQAYSIEYDIEPAVHDYIHKHLLMDQTW
jgi:ADP-L-glycero-D-manno-heptose 6-epimerase